VVLLSTLSNSGNTRLLLENNYQQNIYRLNTKIKDRYLNVLYEAKTYYKLYTVFRCRIYFLYLYKKEKALQAYKL